MRNYFDNIDNISTFAKTQKLQKNMSGESFFSRILTAMGLKTSYESKRKTAYNLLDYKHLIPASVKSKCGYVSEFG